MSYLLELFGDIQFNGLTIGIIIMLIASLIFLYKVYSKLKEIIIKNHEESEARDTKIDETYEEVKKYQEYRIQDKQQNLEIQAQLAESIEDMKNAQKENSDHLKKLDERVLTYELSDTKEKLMQNFRYFTSNYHNPTQAWTELEHEAFLDMLKVYEDRGGDGYMHTVVQPAMENLKIIPMTQLNDIAELMHTRK